MSVVNGSALTLRTDDKGELIGYFLNTTAGKQLIYPTSSVAGATGGQTVTTAISTTTGPHITAVNMTAAAGFTSYISPTNTAVNTVRSMKTGYIWDKQVPTNISGVPINPALALSSITGNSLVLTAGSTKVRWRNTWLAIVWQAWTQLRWHNIASRNITYARKRRNATIHKNYLKIIDGLFINANDINYDSHSLQYKNRRKSVVKYLMTGLNGAAPDVYDQFQIKTYNSVIGRNRLDRSSAETFGVNQ